MLDMKKVKSTNNVEVVGILSELNIEEKITSDNRKYVQGEATIKVDQEYKGELTEKEVVVRLFSMRNKSDGSLNKLYDNILSMRENFTSLAAAESPENASHVSITSGQLRESMYLNKTTNLPVTGGFQLSTNFMNKAKAGEEQHATFELSGVIGDIKDELDNNVDETGRLIVKFIIVNYNGTVDVIDLIAEEPTAVNHIRNNWETGETVCLAGVINMVKKVIETEIEQGFGKPIKKHKTVYRRELVITSGSQSGLDEEFSYDGDAIKLALDERTGRINALSEKNKAKSKPKASSGFSFDSSAGF